MIGGYVALFATSRFSLRELSIVLLRARARASPLVAMLLLYVFVMFVGFAVLGSTHDAILSGFAIITIIASTIVYYVMTMSVLSGHGGGRVVLLRLTQWSTAMLGYRLVNNVVATISYIPVSSRLWATRSFRLLTRSLVQLSGFVASSLDELINNATFARQHRAFAT